MSLPSDTDALRNAFIAALQLSPQQQHAWVNSLDRDARNTLQQLLHIDAELATEGHLQTPEARFATAISYFSGVHSKSVPGHELRPNGSAGDSVPESIGEYKVIRQLGEGGMGAVYLCEDTGHLMRRLAVKVVRASVNSASTKQWFYREQQALALLEHPNIARIVNAGFTMTGNPYFAMEYIAGSTLTVHCDFMRANVRERLQLFSQVCDAVQHAHQKGVIHRDLKPENILVVAESRPAAVKLIDFGLARIVHMPIDGVGTLAPVGIAVGTPHYMSPEQAGAGGQDVDMRTDVFSLGAILYELLTGTTPMQELPNIRLTKEQVLEIVRSGNPSRPSIRLATLGQFASVVAGRRRTSCRELQSILRGDLDWIIMKALDRNRDNRYQTVAQLREDVTRYLNGDPVVARPPSFRYSVRKLLSRHYRACAAVAVICAAVAAPFAVTLDQWRRNANLTESLKQESLRAAVSEKAAREARDTAVFNEKIALAKATESEAAREVAATQTAQAQLRQAEVEKVAESLRRSLGRNEFLLARILRDNLRVGEAMVRLDKVPRESRGIEWGLLREQCDQSAATLYGHSGFVKCVDFSSDNRLLCSVASDRSIRMWDVQSGVNLWTVHSKHVHDVASEIAFSEDGANVYVVFPTPALGIYATEDGRPLREQTLSASAETATAVSLDQRHRVIAAGYRDGSVEVWSVADLTTPVRSIAEAHRGGITGIEFSANGSLFTTTGEDGFVRLWSTQSSMPVREVRPRGWLGPLSDAVISPDARYIAAAKAGHTLGGIVVWDLRSGEQISPESRVPLGTPEIAGSRNAIGDLSFAPDGGSIAAAGSIVSLVGERASAVLQSLYGHRGLGASSVAFNDCGTLLASGGYDGTIRIWPIARQRPVSSHRHTGAVKVAFAHDGRHLLSVGEEGSIVVCAVNGEEPPRVVQHGVSKRTNIATSPKAHLVASALPDHTVIVCSYESPGAAPIAYKGHTDAVLEARFSPDGERLYSLGRDRAIRVWSVGNPLLEPEVIPCSDMECRSIDVSRDGVWLAGVSDSQVRIWDLHRAAVAKDLPLSGLSARVIRFAPDGRSLLVGGWQGHGDGAMLIDVASGSVKRGFGRSPEFCSSVCFSSSGDRVVLAGPSAVTIWDSETGEELLELDGTVGMPVCVDVSMNDDAVAAGSYWPEPTLWRVAKRPREMTICSHTSNVAKVCFSADESRVVSVDAYGTAQTTDITTGASRPSSFAEATDRAARSVSADGSRMVVASGTEVLLLDVTERDSAFRQRNLTKALAFDNVWHRQQRAEARAKDAVYAELFHAHALVEYEPDLVSNRVALTMAAKRWAEWPMRQLPEQGEPVPGLTAGLDVLCRPHNPPLVATVRGWSGCVSSSGEFVLVRQEGGGAGRGQGLYRVDLRTMEAVLLHENGKDQAISFDDSRIAVCRGLDRDTGIDIVSKEGRVVASINHGYMPTWSADGEYVFYYDVQKKAVCKVQIDGSPPESQIVLQDVTDEFAAVSPDGCSVAWIDASTKDLVVTNVVDKTSGAINSMSGLVPSMKCWHPCGCHVAVASFAGGGLWIVNVTSGAPMQVVEHTVVNPRWSSDGRFLTVDNRVSGEVEVYDVRELPFP